MEREPFFWTGKIQCGMALFALSLVYLAFVAPGEVALSTAIGGSAALALYGVTGTRLALGVLIMIMLVIVACALFSAVMGIGLALVPVAAAQIVAVTLMERKTERFWIRHEMLPAGTRI